MSGGGRILPSRIKTLGMLEMLRLLLSGGDARAATSVGSSSFGGYWPDAANPKLKTIQWKRRDCQPIEAL